MATKKRNPTDSTMRNVRAGKRYDFKQDVRFQKLVARVAKLEARVNKLEGK